MNKKVSTLLVALLGIATLVGCDQNSGPNTSVSSNPASTSSADSGISGQVEVDLTAISLDKSELDIVAGSSETLVVTYSPANATNKEIEWTSDNAAIASVDATGKVTAKKVGSATIKATSKKNNQIFATCAVSVKDNVVLSGVDAKHEFVLFEQNRTRDASRDDGFYNHEESYKVGDDNAFNVKPSLTVLDGKTYTPVSTSRWLYDFTITAKLNGEAAGEEYFSVVDARECDVKFTEAAVGKTFTISIAPGGVSADRVASLTKSLTVEVVDGYNVYDAKDIGYFDTREQDFTGDGPTMENDQKWACKWAEFKTANGMRNDYFPKALIFQKDIKVTTADLPANFFYTTQEANALNDSKAAGSLVDSTYLYERTIEGDITVDGNYFELDLSEIPLVKRERCKTTETGKVISHSAAFKAIDGNDVTFRNINMTGNAKNAASDDDKIYGGGFIFVKGAGSKTLTFTNMIATKFFITCMGEESWREGVPPTVFSLDKVKCYDNYNSFIYNWGSAITASNSLFRSCGGPIIIQDHTSSDTYEADNGLTIDGNAPTVNFIDCSLINYVAGSEAWFQQFNATALAPQIKAMSDFFAATGLPKGYAVNDRHVATLSGSFFNFVVLNKSGKAEGVTNVPACGTINIVESNKTTTFNYRQPAYDDVYKAYLVYNAASDEDKPAAQQALLAAASAKGVTFAPDYSDAFDKIQAYITNICTIHMTLRGLNGNGAPVFDLGPAFDLLGYDGRNAFLQNILAIANNTTAKYTPTNEQLAAMPNYAALYFNGMALVMGLSNYGN